MSDDRVNKAIEQLNEWIDESDRNPDNAKILQMQDQIGAKLRDMNNEQWEEVVKEIMEVDNISEDEARNYLGRLSGKCLPDDAEWTGKEIK